MELRAPEYNILSYLVQTNAMSYEQTIEWAYSQYTNKGVDPFIEKLSLAYDASELLQLISNEFQVYGEPSQDFLAGEAVRKYKRDEIKLCEAISRLLFDLDLGLSEEELQELYIAEDYFGWHERPERAAWNHVRDIFNKSHSIYEKAVGLFYL